MCLLHLSGSISPVSFQCTNMIAPILNANPQTDQLCPLGCHENQSSWVNLQGVLGRNEDVKGKEPK